MRWPQPKGCGQAYLDAVHEADLATPQTMHKFGSAEPRVVTPPLRELTPETSLGFQVIEFATDVLGISLHPWQRVALIRMLEQREDGSLRFRTVVILVARQNGKSTLAQVLTLWLLVVYGWPLILGTAQDLDVAQTLWEEVVDIVKGNDELKDLIEKVVLVNGSKSLNLITGARYKVKAANRRAGRGLSGNLVLLDELREHQNFDAWGAITKTTMARAEALILALSNAGDVTSRVLSYLRMLGHKAVGDPDGVAAAQGQAETGPTEYDLEALDEFELDPDAAEALELDEFDDDEAGDLELDDLEQDEDTLCLLEWSAPPGCATRDRDGIRYANPSQGYTISMRTILSAEKTDPEWVFRTEVLCQWNDGASNGPFLPGAWEDTTIETVKQADGTRVIKDPEAARPVGKLVAGVATSHSRGMTYIAFAGHNAAGVPVCQIVTARVGSDWVQPWLADAKRKGRVRAVTGQFKSSPEMTVLRKMQKDTKFRIQVVELSGNDLTDAYADADDALREKRVLHPPDAKLDLAAQTAEKKYFGGGTWLLDAVNSPSDIAPLRAWIAALWLLAHLPAAPPPPPPSSMTLADLPATTTAAASPTVVLTDWHAPDLGDLTGDLGSIGF